MIIQCIQATVVKLYIPAPELKPNNRPDRIQSGRIRPLNFAGESKIYLRI